MSSVDIWPSNVEDTELKAEVECDTKNTKS